MPPGQRKKCCNYLNSEPTGAKAQSSRSREQNSQANRDADARTWFGGFHPMYDVTDKRIPSVSTALAAAR